MSSLQPFVLAAVLCGSGDATLLDFTASWCGPCRAMAPTVQRLHQDGYSVRPIDVDQNPDLARRFGVGPIPCFVMVRDGREVGRIEGTASYEQLVQLFRKAADPDQGPHDPGFRAQSPDPMPRPLAPTAGTADTGLQPGMPMAPRPPSVPNRFDRQPPVHNVRDLAMQATVRLKVIDGNGNSFGTGTIIDTHGGEALIVTCGHIFRESAGKGEIHVDLFAPGAPGPVLGQLVDYEAEDRDIALVAIRPGTEITPIRVAPPSYRPEAGTRIFSIGCDHGDDPSIRDSSISAVDRYVGPPNLEIIGQPVVGRSGGGLFTTDGLLIGICNAADPEEDRGIFASLPTIHWQLKHVGLESVYLGNETMGAEPAPAVLGTPAQTLADSRNPQPTSRLNNNAVDPMTDLINARDTEVMFILRSKTSPDGAPQFIHVDNPSHELLQQLMRESRSSPVLRAQNN
jgi:thiol-disulfide isomerase/thioredoxin